MKAPPERKGNPREYRCQERAEFLTGSLLSERKGNPREYRCQGAARRRLNESPSKKGREMRMVWASTSASAQGLNESPSEKEGKSALAREGMLGESDPQ